MREIMYKMRKCGVFLAFLLVLTLVSGALDVRADGTAAGEPYEEGTVGSLTVELTENGSNRENVEVLLYKVGTLDTSNGYLWFKLEEGLEASGVDLNDITTGEANIAAAETLLQILKDNGVEPVRQWTNAQGKAAFADLEQGMYLVAQGTPNAYGTFSPLVVPIPLADETKWDYDPVVSPKAIGETGVLGRIDVTKRIKGITSDGNLQDLHADNATYYVGLFLDPDGTRPYGGEEGYFKPVHIMDGDSATISFANIPITGQPYYIFETTETGQPITYLENQGTENVFYCMAGEVLGAEGYDRAPQVILEEEADGVGNALISNVYSGDLPEGYYYTGEITISKSVMDEGQMIASGDTFYAGIFVVDAQGNRAATPTEVVKLANNSTVTVEVPLGGADGTEPITYAVLETDENGTPINKQSFPYTVTGEGNVSLSMDQQEATVNLVNTLGGGEGYYQEEPSTEAPSTTDPGSGNDKNTGGDRSSSGTNRSTTSKKTGDDNQILLYAGLLAAAVLIGGAVVVRRRRRNG